VRPSEIRSLALDGGNATYVKPSHIASPHHRVVVAQTAAGTATFGIDGRPHLGPLRGVEDVSSA
jgi:hypothetical protein